MAEGERSGHLRQLGDMQLEEIKTVLQHLPESISIYSDPWDDIGLPAFIKKGRYHIILGVRQRQYMVKFFDFHRLKPRPLVTRAGSDLQDNDK